MLWRCVMEDVAKRLGELRGLAQKSFQKAVTTIVELCDSYNPAVQAEAQEMRRDLGRARVAHDNPEILDKYMASLLKLSDLSFIYEIDRSEVVSRFENALSRLTVLNQAMDEKEKSRPEETGRMRLAAKIMDLAYEGMEGARDPHIHFLLARLKTAGIIMRETIEASQPAGLPARPRPKP